MSRSAALRWLPPVALMAFIFFLSAQPDFSTGEGPLHVIARKLGHAAVFALLCFLWWRALRPSVRADRAPILALVATLAYAITDEYHQTFVPGRQGAVSDVAIDLAGAVIAAFAVREGGWRTPGGELGREKQSDSQVPRDRARALAASPDAGRAGGGGRDFPAGRGSPGRSTGPARSSAGS